MVLCMVLFISEIYVVVVEVGWVLRLGGKFIYIVWYIGDVYYGVGQVYGDDIFECVGFVVYFFCCELVVCLVIGWVFEEVYDFEEGELFWWLWWVIVIKFVQLVLWDQLQVCIVFGDGGDVVY